ncbi:MAG: hypothetical protein QFX37_07260 [Archaeoglobales archaeon]|nr:hypothetical protein [Archaeoglobales archaeon]
MFEGKSECIKMLLSSAERVLRQGRDIYRENFEKRKKLWNEISEAYERYLNGECGEFIKNLDKVFCGKFEAALALIALSFKINGENFDQRRFNDEDLVFVDEITKFNVLEVLSIEDIVKKLSRRDKNVYELLKTYYLGIDSWMEEQLENPNISLALRYHFRSLWNGYKEKLNNAIAEANKYDWFRAMFEDWDREKRGIVEDFSIRVRELENRLQEMQKGFEMEKSKIISDISSKSEIEIENLRREKEELIQRFEKEKEEIAKAIAEMKDREVQEKLQKELENAKGRFMGEIKAVEEALRKREEEIMAKEREIESKEEKLRKMIAEITGMKEKIEKGSRFLKSEEARMMELNFLERLKAKLKEFEFNGRKFRTERIDEFGLQLKDVPQCSMLEFELKEKKIFGAEKLKILAFFFTRPQKFAKYGFDTDPMELGEIDKYVSNFRKAKIRTAIVVASPLGFEERIKSFINSEEFHRNFYSESISLLLLDTETNEIIFNPVDSLSKALSRYVQLEMDNETYLRVKNCIEEKLKSRDHLSLNEVLACGEERYVKKAFYELADKYGFVKYFENFGLVLVKREVR